MDALLGMAAFHLRSTMPFDAAISKASHTCMIRAISSHAKQIHDGINPDSVPSLLATGTIIMFHTSANQTFLDGPCSAFRLPLHWFRPFRNANTLLRATWSSLKNSEVSHLYTPAVHSLPCPPQAGANKFEFLLSDLSLDELEPDVTEAYQSAVYCLARIYSTPLQRDILRFPALVPPRFVDLLEAGDPRTLAIVGYFFMLMGRATHLWWAQGAAEKEFAAVMSFLPKKWLPMMTWAMEELNWREDNRA